MIKNAKNIDEAVALYDTVKQHVTLKKSGLGYQGCCPFHNEKTASFVVTPSKNIFKCFGCGKSGKGSAKFLMEFQNITYFEAIEQLSKKANIPIEFIEDAEASAIRFEKDNIQIVNKLAAEYYHNNIFGSAGYEYLIERGYNDEIISYWNLGYAKDSWDILTNYIKTKGANIDTAISAGLLSKKIETGKIFDKIRDRIIFPFYDLAGNNVGYTGRYLLQKGTEPKYMNSPENAAFSKSNFLFGLFQAQMFIQKANEVYVVEGQTDCITLHAKELNNTVASSGTAFTDGQIALLKRFTKNIILFTDGDEAGRTAVWKDIDICLSKLMNVKVVTLPESEDPDTLFKPMSLQQINAYLLENTHSWFDYKCNIAEVDRENLEKFTEIVNSIKESLSFIPDEVLRNEYIKRLEERFKLKEISIKAKFTEEKLHGFVCFEEAKEIIKKVDKVHVLTDIEKVITNHLNGDMSYIGLNGHIITEKHILDLKRCTSNVIVESKLDWNRYDKYEPKYVQDLKLLLKNRFNISVPIDFDQPVFVSSDEDQKDTTFTNWYLKCLIDHIFGNDDDYLAEIIENLAETLSYIPETLRGIKQNFIQEQLKEKKVKITSADFRKTLKKYERDRVREYNTEITKHIEIPIAESFDPQNLPKYVDKSEFLRLGYFAVQNNKKQHVYFLVKDKTDNLITASNFHFQMLGHVYHKESLMNKRLLKMTHETGEEKYLELLSSDLRSYENFIKRVYDVGSYFFYKRASWAYEKILSEISRDIPKMTELTSLGHNQMGFYSFSDGIYNYTEKLFVPFDRMGFAKFGKNVFYCKVFSVFNDRKTEQIEVEEKNEDPKEFFVYDRTNSPAPIKSKIKAGFNEYLKLLYEVYQLDNSGIYAFIFTLITAYRDILMQKIGHCPLLLLTGETNAGKSQVAESIMNMFAYKFPIFNLLSGSDAAFFNAMEFATNFPLIGDEYNDVQVSDTKFQGAKATYDGIGKQKISSTNINERKVYQILVTLGILGQEMPERDDQALLNRSLHAIISKKNFTEEEDAKYQKLKDFENAGLSEVLCTILSKRTYFEVNFARNEKQLKLELKAELDKKPYVTRILNTGSEFLATAKTFMEASPELQFPFDYKFLKDIILKKIINMSELVTATNRVSNFFDVLSHLTNMKKLVYGREYIVTRCDSSLKVKNVNGETISATTDGLVLFIRLKDIFNYYKDVQKQEALKYNNLRSYLKNHSAYHGEADDITFRWFSKLIVDDSSNEKDPITGKFEEKSNLREKSVEETKRTSCMAFNYKDLNIDLLPAETQYDKKSEEMPF